jgi:hypothetical protein
MQHIYYNSFFNQEKIRIIQNKNVENGTNKIEITRKDISENLKY